MKELYQALCVAEQAVNAIWPYVAEKSIAERELDRRKAESKYYYSNYKPGIIMLKICIPIMVICCILALVLPRGLFGSLSGGSFMALFVGMLALAGVLTGVILKSTYGKKHKEAELSLQQCTKNDYANKLKVKKHNTAYKKLKLLQDEMKQIDNEEMLHLLLNHEDDRVKINAASFCLQICVLVEKDDMYFLIEFEKRILYGPYSNEEFINHCFELSIPEMGDWLTTKPRPQNAMFSK